MLIQNTTFTLSSDAAIFNFMVFLNEFPDNEGYSRVTSVEFTSLSLFEKGVFKSNAAWLLQKCPNVQHLSIIAKLEALKMISPRGWKELDVGKMLRTYDLAKIPQMGQLKQVSLSLEPFMALQKRLVSMEGERRLAEQSRGISVGIESFWGLKEWLEMQALDRMRLIDVKCPTIMELFAGNLGLASV